MLSACSTEDRKEIRVTPTSTVEAGVRVIVDNCPGPTSVTLSVREEILWRIETTLDETEVVEGDLSDQPALVEFLVGTTPEEWVEVERLEQTLSEGIRYTLLTEPDGQSVDFSLPDLAPGLVFNGVGNDQFSQNFMTAECSEPADVGLFARNMIVLIALWLTAAALVMVSLILLLFVITRRFSRIRSIERRIPAEEATAQRPTARSSR